MGKNSSRLPSFVVVIGDQDRDLLDALKDRRASIESDVLQAETIDDAVERILASRTDLAVVPEDIAGQSHLELCRRIKQLCPRVATLVIRENLDDIPPSDPAIDDYATSGDNDDMMARINVLLSLKTYNARALPIRERILEAFQAFDLKAELLADGRLLLPSKVPCDALLDPDAIHDQEAALSKLGDTAFACYRYAPEPECLVSSGRDGCLRGVCPVAQVLQLEPGFGVAVEECQLAAWRCARDAMLKAETCEALCPGGYRLAAFPVSLRFRGVRYPLLAVCAALPSAIDSRQLGRLARQVGLDPHELRVEVSRRPLPQLTHVHLDALIRIEENLAAALSRQVSNEYATAYNVLVEAVERGEHDRANARRSRQLQRANERLRDMNRLKSEFLANVSHELKTPMTSVIGFSSLLLRGAGGELSDKAEHFVERVLANARSLHAAINDILDFADLSTRPTEVSVTEFDLPPLVDECLEAVQPTLGDKAIELRSDLAPDLPSLKTDRERLRQVLMNLLKNAAKFTNEGHIRVAARLEKGEPCDRLAVAVADTGVGLSEDALPHIFEEFRQVDGSSTRRHGGAGLGLSLVQHLCRLLDGEVSVESRLDEGSTFTVTIPVDLEQCQQAREELKAQALAAEPDPGDRSTPIVLVAGHAPQLMLDVRQWLEPHGYRVASAFDLAEAAERTRAVQPCVLLLDVVAPGSDVWELADELRGDPATTDVPLFVVSSLGGREVAEAAGAVEWLERPLDPDALLNALGRLHAPDAGHVLVIDGRAARRGWLRRILREAGYQVTACATVGDASRYAGGDFDVIVLDPEAEGEGELTALGSLRTGPWAHVPLVALTPADLPAARRQRLAAQSAATVDDAQADPPKLLEAVAHVIQTAREDATAPEPP